jgi:hypothetical protein
VTLELAASILRLLILVVTEIVGAADRARAAGEKRQAAIAELEKAVAVAMERMRKETMADSADAAKAEDAADAARNSWPTDPPK